MPPSRLAVLAASLLVASVVRAAADEGMWTFDKLPLERLAWDHQFIPPPGWAEHLQLSAVRLAQGCSASFVSASGLVLSNHHCARDCVQGLSSPGHDLIADGFYAIEAAEERRCADLEVDQLDTITHVTDQVRAATAGTSGAAFHRAERKVIAAIEAACGTGDAVRCQVVTLFHGGAYDLYHYKRFQDVRLVFVPEEAVAAFGDTATADWPLHALDMSLFRVYADGKPLDTTATHLTLAPVAAKEGDLVFVAGNPGNTERLETMAQLEYQRDVSLPIGMADFSELHGAMLETAGEGAELARQANFSVFISELSAGRLTSEHRALSNTPLLAAKAAQEAALRAKVAADPALAARFGGAWDAVAGAVARQREIAERFIVLEREPRVSQPLYDAIRLVRAAAETDKPDGERLAEYSDAQLPQMRASILAPAPLYAELETRKLAWLLSRLPAHLGTADEATKALLGAASPHDAAAALVGGTGLMDVAVRRALLDGGAAAVAASDDPLIVFARDRWEPRARAVRKTYDEEVDAVVTPNAALIDQARLAALGGAADPDATFTPRLSYGVVRGYSHEGVAQPAITTIGEAYGLDTGRDPFRLPKIWLDAKAAIDPAAPLDLALTADIVGGNSGSPLVDREGNLVGLIFAGNDAAEARTYGYDDREARSIAVTVPAIRTALETIYRADRVVQEFGN